MPQHINIKTVAGGNSTEQNQLKSLYFLETAKDSGQFQLFGTVNNQPNTLIPTVPATLSGGGTTTSFTFTYGGVNWTVTGFFIGHAGMGNWSNPNDFSQDDGTFVAQAGGTREDEPVEDESEEDASAASA